MIITQDLRQTWGNLSNSGKIVTRSKFDKGEIEIGIKIDHQTPTYYATEVYSDGTRRVLDGKIVERLIDGTDFVIQYNQFRGYKPVSNGNSIKEGYNPAPKEGVEDCLFYCNNPSKPLSLLVRETAGQISLKNGAYNIYHNAFPIEEEGHFMYVPVKRERGIDAIPHISQRLNREIVEDILTLSKNSTDAITFFNSIHAGASVNHLHIQQVHYRRNLKDSTPLRKGKLAIDNAETIIYECREFLKDYPINGMVFENEDNQSIWNEINIAQINDIPFNWILTGDRNYLVPRRREFEKVSEFFNILASLEITGKIVVANERTFLETKRRHLFNGFGKMSYSMDEIIRGYLPIQISSYDPCNQCAERLMGVAGESCLGCSHA